MEEKENNKTMQLLNFVALHQVWWFDKLIPKYTLHIGGMWSSTIKEKTEVKQWGKMQRKRTGTQRGLKEVPQT